MIRLSFLVIFCLITCASNAQVLPTIKYQNIHNKNLAYYEAGDGEDVVVLLHGWPQTSYVWRKVFNPLSKDYKVIAIDLPGLGRSDLINNYTTEDISKIIYEFIKLKGLKNVHLVGHDLGTWVALTYGITYESSLKTLTLVDAGIPGLMNLNVFQPENANKIWQFYFHGINDLPEILVKGKEKEYFNWYFNTKSHIKNAISGEDEAVYVASYKEEGRMAAGFEYYRAYEKNAIYNKANIKTLSLPVLAIGGEKALGLNVGNALTPFVKNLVNVSLLNSGHYVPEEQPEALITELKKLINNNK